MLTTYVTFRFIDIRCREWSHYLCAAPAFTGSGIRAMAPSPCGNAVCVGLSGGQLSLLDVRTGRIISHAQLQLTEVTKVRVML